MTGARGPAHTAQPGRNPGRAEFFSGASPGITQFIDYRYAAGRRKSRGGLELFSLMALAVILVAGTLVAGWYLSRVISIIAEGKPLSQPASRFLSIAFWVAFGTGLAVGLNLMLGGNLVTRDLGIAEAGFTNGVTTMGSFVWLGVLGLIQVFRLALQRGQRAEDELEGVI